MNRPASSFFRFLPLVLFLLIGATACGTDPELQQAVDSTSSTPTSSTTTTSTLSATETVCGDEFPIFYPGLEPVAGLVSTGQDGEQIRTWVEDEYGLKIEAIWPGELPEQPTAGMGSVLHRSVLENGTQLVLQIDEPPGCDLLSVTLTADRIEPLVDFELSFIEDIRPISELDEYLSPPEPDIAFVPSEPAYRVIEQFLEAMAAQEWEFASSLLFNEGWSQDVEDQLGLNGDNLGEAPALLEQYCADALCSAPFELISVERDGPWISAVVVELESQTGTVQWPVRLGQFEGMFSISELPPKGSAAPRTILSQRLFGAEETFSVIWYDTFQFNDPTGGHWGRWWGARFGDNQILNRWGISSYGNTLAIEDLVGEFETEFLEFEDLPYAGAGVFGGREVIYLGADNVLLEVDVASLNVEPKLEASDPEAFVGPADARGNTVGMLVGVGDSLWVEFYDGDLELISSTRGEGVYTWFALDPDGATAAVAIELELNVINQVGLVDVATGTLLESWGYEGTGLIGEVAYNGKYIVAKVYGDADEPPELFIVDTASGVSRLVKTSARIQF